MADILNSEGISGAWGRDWLAPNPTPEEASQDLPVYVRMSEGYRTRGLDRNVYVEEIVSLLGDLLMTNATDEEADIQSEKWDLVARSSKAEWDCFDQGFVALVHNKAIDGAPEASKHFHDGAPGFWVMGSNLKPAYDILANAGIFIKVGDDYWHGEER